MSVANAWGRSEPHNFVQRFTNSEEGAVATDWVVITGFIVLMAAFVGFNIVGGTKELAEKEEKCLKAYTDALSTDQAYLDQLNAAKAGCDAT